MIHCNSGHIVTVASIAGHVGVPGLLDYCASKFAAVGIDNALRFELYDTAPQVKTLCVCPHYISTGMFAGVSAGRFPWLVPTLTPQYVAERVVGSIIAGDAVLFMPRFVKLVPLLKDTVLWGPGRAGQNDVVSGFIHSSPSLSVPSHVLFSASAELMPLSLFAAPQPCIQNFIPRVRLRIGSKFSSPHASCSGW